MRQTHHQSASAMVVLWTLGSLAAGIRAGHFEEHDQPKPLDPGDLEADFAHLKGNTISDQAEDPCPFSSKGDADDGEDWQIIGLPHGDPQFHHVDHLPMKVIDYSWPSKARANKYSPPDTEQFSHQRWENNNNNNLDGRKLFLEKKFHYKAKPTPPANLLRPKSLSEPPQKFDSKKSALYGMVEQPPIVTMFASHKTGSSHNLDQPNDELLVQSEQEQPSAGAASPVSDSPVAQPKATMDVMELNYANNQPARTRESPPSERTNRVRESFQAAAQLARHLEDQQPESRSSRNNSNSSSGGSGSVDQMFNLNSTSGNSNLVDWDVVEPSISVGGNSSSFASTLTDTEQQPRYLGFGQVYKADNLRSSTQQARLSCSFGPQQDPDRAGQEAAANMTVSHVQWARFVGNYDPEQAEPSFGCKFRTCRVMEVKNDIWTTVHPRPAVQHYLGGQLVPSYSLTLHQVDPERHIGVYRCSALRQMGDRKQLVYRIVPFT